MQFFYGADAIYIGGENFSFSSRANNFSLDEIKKAILFCHKNNKKLCIAVILLLEIMKQKN